MDQRAEGDKVQSAFGFDVNMSSPRFERSSEAHRPRPGRHKIDWRLDFVMLQNLVPAILRLEEQFHYFADRAFAARDGRHVVRDLLHFGPGVGGGDGEADAAHDHHVGEIVADVGHLAGVDFGVGQDLFEDRDLLGVALVDVLELALFGALRRWPARRAR